MRRLAGMVLLFAGMLGFQSIAYGQGVKSSMKIDKVDVTKLAKGADVIVTVTLTRGTNDPAVKSTTHYFRDTNNFVVAATVDAFTPPTAGNSVTYTFKPYNNPFASPAGGWTAYASFNDGTKNYNANKTFTMP